MTVRLVAQLPDDVIAGYSDNEGLWQEETGFREPPVKAIPWIRDAGWLPDHVHASIARREQFSPSQVMMLVETIQESLTWYQFDPGSQTPERVLDLMVWLKYWGHREGIGVVIESSV